MPGRLAAVLTAAAALWALAIVAVPIARSPSLATALVYGAGTLVCHQRPERSFHLHDNQMPVCARCAGLYVSGAIGAIAAWLSASAVPRRTRAVLLAAVAPTLATVLLERVGVPGFSNAVRCAAALPAGGAAGWLFVRMLRAEARPAHKL